jgi:AraC-like DNA-binding protein
MITRDRKWRMPATYLKVILQEARAANLSVEPLLAATDLTQEELLTSDEPVSFANTLQVLANAERLLGPGWHLLLAARLTVPSHGPLGFAVVTAPDMRSSVEVLLRFIGTRAPFLWSAGAIEGDEFVFRFYETADMGDQRRTLMELAALSLQGLMERPLGRAISGAKLAFAYSEPPYADMVRQVFNADVSFSADQYALRFPAAWLDEPCALHEDSMHRYLLNRCEDDLLASAGSLPAEIAVRQALLARPGEIPSLAEIAASQHVSPRTLIRRLKRGNTSYQRILNDVRKTLSRDFLLNSSMSIARISWRLGYQDPSNFSRAFRGWYGVSPQHYRKPPAAHSAF